MLLPHNQETYLKVCATLDKTCKCAIIQATGTGKSYLTMELLEKRYPRTSVLYVVPNHAISLSISMYPEFDWSRVTFLTYTALTLLDDIPAYVSRFGCVVLDELHHANAPQWGKAVCTVMHCGVPVLGLTATPKCGTVNPVNIAKALFQDAVVYGPDVFEAVKRGILPKFDYVAFYGDIESRIKEMEQRLLGTPHYDIFKQRVRTILPDGINSITVGSVVKQYSQHIHWLVYFDSLDAMYKSDSLIRAWFGDEVHIYTVDNKLSKRELLKTLNQFSSSTTLSVLCSVGCLGEGVHLHNVDAAIFLRRTSSQIVFLQQLGRVLSVSNKCTPVIIDVVGNYMNFEKDTHTCRSIVKGLGIGTNPITEKVLLLDSVLLELEDLFKKNKDVYWSPRELRILQMQYPVEGSFVAERLPGKSAKECIQKAHELGLFYKRKWAVWEDELVAKLYRSNFSLLQSKLKHRTAAAIHSRANKLKVSWSVWLEEDDNLLIQLCSEHGEDGLYMMPHKSYESCATEIQKLYERMKIK